ncbi:hypothetical protein Rsub_04323 [Raphidocelis subcapitata]|uniref:Uncharacterized protein n=1 Tax=Raphidocelis subcapitata TaxID=307507 RepID=A0A2V0P163_9CHLO|nr:hypothetical protein Rsub_04323 [Raphidocelis subcapitata]|eukprot:GBF91583.1 hypothetical protein Rsub_04323 [Raphidocelis subcapitata]
MARRQAELEALLRGTLAEKQAAVDRLARDREALLVRLTALSLTARCQIEVSRHYAALGAPHGSFGEGRVASMQLAADDAGGALAVAAGGGSASSGAAAEAGNELLADLPHLAPGASLLDLEGVTREEVEWYRRMSLADLKAHWRTLVEEGRPLLFGQSGAAGRAPASAAAATSAVGRSCGSNASGSGSAGEGRAQQERLADLGRRMSSVLALVSLHNIEVYMRFVVTRTDGDEVVSGDADAGLAHWEAVLRGVRYTRTQAVLICRVCNNFFEQLAPLRAERAELSRAFAAAPPAGAGPPPLGGGGGAGPDCPNWPPHGDAAEVLARIEENTACERATICLVAQVARALNTPAQCARIWVLAYPYPVHMTVCISVLEHDLKFRPETFVATVD